MSICYLNGDYIDSREAKVSIFDRGFLFADGVYEVTLVLNGQLVDNRGHLARLGRSLEKVGISKPLSDAEIIAIQEKLIADSGLSEGGVYLQITRGTEDKRDFAYKKETKPTVLLLPFAMPVLNNPAAERGVAVMSYPEIRWAHRDIKAIGLMGAVLAKNAAKAAGYDDAWFVEAGVVTESSASNAFIVKDKTIITKAANSQILDGITRTTLKRFIQENGYTLDERGFSILEAQQADEAFISSAVQLVLPVISVDGIAVGSGEAGPVAKQLRKLYIEEALLGNIP